MYGNTTDLIAYAAARGVTLSADPAVLLIQSNDYIESLEYKGTRATDAAKWPRSGVYVDGVLLDDATVPQLILDATYAQAIAIDQGVGAQANITPAVKREKVDVLEIEYQDGASSSAIELKTLAILRPVLYGGNGANVINVSRG